MLGDHEHNAQCGGQAACSGEYVDYETGMSHSSTEHTIRMPFMAFAEAQRIRNEYYRCMRNASAFTVVDQFFTNHLHDCRARRKAAILRATQAVRQYDNTGVMASCR